LRNTRGITINNCYLPIRNTRGITIDNCYLPIRNTRGKIKVMKLEKEKSRIIIILITIFFTGIICWYFYGELENSRQKTVIKDESMLEEDPILMMYKAKYKKRYAILWRSILLYPKEVFLTFDDGPSINNTLDIIDTLNHNSIKATFFVVGQRAEAYPEVIKKMNASGMCIAAHTYTHIYSNIYESTEAYLKDIEKCNNTIKTLVNRGSISYIRMPGGSDNKVSSAETLKKIRASLKKKNINYVDWNVSSEDALGRNVEALKIKQNIMSQSKGKSMVVILMHDSYYKKTTVDSLQEVINYFKKQGYTFRTFNDLTEEEKQKMIKKGVLNR
jgi:peptidoglycan/xylan/chitin deacetylase (PgdA/CDA1 family)